MDLHCSAATGVLRLPLERDDSPPVRSSRIHARLEIVEEALGKLEATLAVWDGHLDVDSSRRAVLHSRAQQQGERQVAFLREPQSVLEAAHGRRVADVDIVVLEGSEVHRKWSGREQVRERRGLEADGRVNTQQRRLRATREEMVD